MERPAPGPGGAQAPRSDPGCFGGYERTAKDAAEMMVATFLVVEHTWNVLSTG